MTDKKFNEFIKKEKGDKYLEELKSQGIKTSEQEVYVYVKDFEGYAAYKSKNELIEGDSIISEKEYNELVGKKIVKYTRGGTRQGAGRKRLFKNPKRATFEFEAETLIELKIYAKKNKRSQNEIVNEALKKIINQ